MTGGDAGQTLGVRRGAAAAAGLACLPASEAGRSSSPPAAVTPTVSKAPPIMGVFAASDALDTRKTSATALVEAALARISAVDGKVRAFVHVAAEEARAAAAAADKEIAGARRRSPVHGVPFAVKDNYEAAGMPASAGSSARAGMVSARDAALVARLKDAGAILIGKLATWEYGTGNGGEYFDLPSPPARNPWDLERFTGGSSTGVGAAVVAGMVPFGLGSDTTGSVRLPAAATGVVGAIPTPGTLPLDGLLPNCHALDVPGPLARSVTDAALVLDAIAGRDPADPGSLAGAATARTLGGMRIAVVRETGPAMPELDPAVAAALDTALETLRACGAELVETALPVAAADCLALTRIIGPVESAALHEAELRKMPDRLGAALRDKLLAGAAVRAVDYLQALRTRAAYAETIRAFLGGFDALVTYGPLTLPPRLGVEPEMTAFTTDTMLTPFNIASVPVIAQPNGAAANGLPTSWQIVAGPGREQSIFRVAGAFEAATRWHERQPTFTGAPTDPAPRPLGPQSGAEVKAIDPAVLAYAKRAGLDRLSPADLARLGALLQSQGKAGGALPRVTDKTIRAAFAHPPLAKASTARTTG